MIVLKFCPKVNRPTLQLGTAVLEFAAVRIINMCKYLNERKKNRIFLKSFFLMAFMLSLFDYLGYSSGDLYSPKCKQSRCSVASNSGKR